MRYRRLSYRYAMVVQSGQTWPFGDIWLSDRLRLAVQPRWRPDADRYETATTVEIIVDLAGVEEDDFEVQLFEDMLVVEGHVSSPRAMRARCTMRPASARGRSRSRCRCRCRSILSASRRDTIRACSTLRCPSVPSPADGRPVW